MWLFATLYASFSVVNLERKKVPSFKAHSLTYKCENEPKNVKLWGKIFQKVLNFKTVCEYGCVKGRHWKTKSQSGTQLLLDFS